MKKVISDQLRELLKDPEAARALRHNLRKGAEQASFKIRYVSQDHQTKDVTLKLVGGA